MLPESLQDWYKYSFALFLTLLPRLLTVCIQLIEQTFMTHPRNEETDAESDSSPRAPAIYPAAVLALALSIDPDDPPPDADCAVCLSAFQQRCRTACGHDFCHRCLIQVLKSKRPHTSGTCPCCRARISTYTILDATTRQPLRTPAATSMYGSVYVQGTGTQIWEGAASYHFESEEDAYISYDNRRCEDWKLDDGSSPPKKKPFECTSFDPATRTFHGNITWHPVTFHGSVRWEYEMVFSEDYESIIAGSCSTYQTAEPGARPASVDPFGPGGVLHYQRLAPPPTSIFGCLYVQVRGQGHGRGQEGLASYHFDGPDDCYISYSNELCNRWPPLDDGSRPPPKKPFENTSYDTETRTFRGTINWAPTSWQGCVRWEYRMVFSEDFDEIAGDITKYTVNPDGEVVADHNSRMNFGEHLKYRRIRVTDEM